MISLGTYEIEKGKLLLHFFKRIHFSQIWDAKIGGYFILFGNKGDGDALSKHELLWDQKQLICIVSPKSKQEDTHAYTHQMYFYEILTFIFRIYLYILWHMFGVQFGINCIIYF